MRALIAALLLATAPVLAACAPQPAANPALWRIIDADSEIWLFGTTHMLAPETRWRSARVNSAFAAAEELVTETDASDAGAAAAQALSAELGAASPDAPLSSVLDESQRAALARVAARLRIDPAQLESARPWLAALQLSYAYAYQRGLRAEYGVESVLGAEARARGLRMSFFETPEQQVRFLADLPADEQARFLADTLHEIEAEDATFDALDELWAQGETARLAALFDAQWQTGSPLLREVIILQRNRAWADEIARRLDGEGRVFIAVGAAHLIGEGNVIALLRERGIEVEGP
ncbi:MAG TPA: TraB/GumN family protein [Terricaulis sp.]|nr:TraB/GumN family protein [Terricaulis sp.]